MFKINIRIVVLGGTSAYWEKKVMLEFFFQLFIAVNLQKLLQSLKVVQLTILLVLKLVMAQKIVLFPHWTYKLYYIYLQVYISLFGVIYVHKTFCWFDESSKKRTFYVHCRLCVFGIRIRSILKNRRCLSSHCRRGFLESALFSFHNLSSQYFC